MPPKIKPDDLVEALLDGRVVEALAKAVSPFMKKTIDKCLTERLEVVSKTIKDVQQNNNKLQGQVQVLEKTNTELRQQTTRLTERLEALESYSKLDNLIIKGLPEKSYAERGSLSAESSDVIVESQASVMSTVLTFCKDTLHVPVMESDVSTAHRMKAGPKDKIRPIIVRFTSRRVRDAIFRARKALKDQPGSKVYVSEHLTRTASSLFYDARKLHRERKIHSTWTQNGTVFVKTTADPGCKPTAILSAAALSNLMRNG